MKNLNLMVLDNIRNVALKSRSQNGVIQFVISYSLSTEGLSISNPGPSALALSPMVLGPAQKNVKILIPVYLLGQVLMTNKC